mmetsp:Transcript_9606/g.29074  ORF Transcript_9606/g.29074 Transcript_9606/m.29074 type:complete len:396 (+) Transcript_9606:891-2078(+)|eukprot:CAMPEP_0198723040 /NCGR_PEP_ID=MMETSP1475-20131203/590_1 /TAXON_ID= ORGANISM="Unidentified sp., Strain CCMP1999" /NCGR_SAMPLE_ID=MMETSP1475 /ASSEMBLY_ACC=CAM_ASM_001111 /LENGTH=395 /DNA_ID=CAMNT_0044484021 /DNA_START=909 /DNA_END=2096 /DNA_ORIENTATION=+
MMPTDGTTADGSVTKSGGSQDVLKDPVDEGTDAPPQHAQPPAGTISGNGNSADTLEGKGAARASPILVPALTGAKADKKAQEFCSFVEDSIAEDLARASIEEQKAFMSFVEDCRGELEEFLNKFDTKKQPLTKADLATFVSTMGQNGSKRPRSGKAPAATVASGASKAEGSSLPASKKSRAKKSAATTGDKSLASKRAQGAAGTKSASAGKASAGTAAPGASVSKSSATTKKQQIKKGAASQQQAASAGKAGKAAKTSQESAEAKTEKEMPTVQPPLPFTGTLNPQLTQPIYPSSQQAMGQVYFVPTSMLGGNENLQAPLTIPFLGNFVNADNQQQNQQKATEAFSRLPEAGQVPPTVSNTPVPSATAPKQSSAPNKSVNQVPKSDGQDDRGEQK